MKILKLEDLMRQWCARVDLALDTHLPSDHTTPESLHRAMRYAVLNGGKRMRPFLVYAAGQAVGANQDCLDIPACAVELIHAYSLVHDDLPAMDNDDLRRGQPTCHKAFDEATAILAGDALQALAFHLLAHKLPSNVPAATRLTMIDILASASGSRGMAGGQAIDLAAVGKELTLAELENMHIHKTGALIRASVRLGAMCQPAIEASTLDALDHYAKCIGLAFQIHDDILDVEGDTDTLGKTQGKDLAHGKPTYPALVGLDSSRQMAAELIKDALHSLAGLAGDTSPLRELANFTIQRQN